MVGDTYEPLTVFGIALNKEQVEQFSTQLKEEMKEHFVATYDDVDDLTPTQIFKEASTICKGVESSTTAIEDVRMHVISDHAYSRWEGLDPSEYEEYCDTQYVLGIDVENGTTASELVGKEKDIFAIITRHTFIKRGDVCLYTGIKI